MQSNVASFLSELSHFISLNAKSSMRNLDHGILIISIDIDAGHEALGIINKGKNDAYVNDFFTEYAIGQIEGRAFPIFIALFNDFEIPATFAIRGQLTEVDNSIQELFKESTVDHDIGAHGYYHREFTTLTSDEAEDELRRIHVGMRKSGIVPQSFVFPKNSVAHLELLEKYGYKCYRGHGGLIKDCMLISKEGSLFEVHSSLYIDQYSHHRMLERILDIAIVKKLPFHIWFHLWNFGQSQDEMSKCVSRIFKPFFRYAKKKVRTGNLACASMISATNTIREYIE
jgi:hypothetical protein